MIVLVTEFKQFNKYREYRKLHNMWMLFWSPNWVELKYITSVLWRISINSIYIYFSIHIFCELNRILNRGRSCWCFHQAWKSSEKQLPEGKQIIWFWLKIMQTNTFFDFKHPCTYQKGEARKALWELIFMELSPVWSVTKATVLFFQTFSKVLVRLCMQRAQTDWWKESHKRDRAVELTENPLTNTTLGH